VLRQYVRGRFLPAAVRRLEAKRHRGSGDAGQALRKTNAAADRRRRLKAGANIVFLRRGDLSQACDPPGRKTVRLYAPPILPQSAFVRRRQSLTFPVHADQSRVHHDWGNGRYGAPSVARMIGARFGAADDPSHFNLFKTPLPAPARVALCASRTKAERLFSSLVFTVADCTGCCGARERPELAIAGVIQFAKL
jgi:hypothetical protein